MAKPPVQQEVVELYAEEVTPQHVSQLAAEHTPRAVKTLAGIMDSGKTPDMARIAASKTLLEFAHGKAPQAVLHVNQRKETDWTTTENRRKLARMIAFFGVDLENA